VAKLLAGADPGAAVGAKGPVILRYPQTGPTGPAEKGVSLNRLLAIRAGRHLHPKLKKISTLFNISFYYFNFKAGGGDGRMAGKQAKVPWAPGFFMPSFKKMVAQASLLVPVQTKACGHLMIPSRDLGEGPDNLSF
jgi:hypothetical protein